MTSLLGSAQSEPKGLRVAALAVAGAFAIIFGGVETAEAGGDHRGRGHHGYHGHHHHRHGPPPRVYYAPPPRYYYAPPPRVYYAPPPVYYAPPAYVEPSINFVFPIRIK